MRRFSSVVVDGVRDNPSLVAGLSAFAVAFSLVAGNALYGQRGGHPFPLFETRDPTVTRSAPRAETEVVGAARPRKPKAAGDEIPVPEMRPRATKLQETEKPAPEASTMVRDAQAALKAAGFYDGAVDGLYGPKTRAAILRFQAEAGLPQTGQVDASLADRIAATQETGAGLRVAQDPPPVAPAVQPAAPAAPTVVAVDVRDVRDSALIARVQIGLINFGEAGISVDGMIGDQTIEAIRKFQSRYGLEVTGMPDETVIRKLVEIGALKNG